MSWFSDIVKSVTRAFTPPSGSALGQLIRGGGSNNNNSGGGGGSGITQKQYDALAAKMDAQTKTSDQLKADALKSTQLTDYTNKLNKAVEQGAQGAEAARTQFRAAEDTQRGTDAIAASSIGANQMAGAQQSVGGGAYNPAIAVKLGAAGSPSGISGGYQQPTTAGKPPLNQIGAGTNRFDMPDTSKIYGGS